MTAKLEATPRRLLPAQVMAAAVDTDPQFHLPERPRLLPGLVTVPLADGLLFEGAAERQVLRGRSAHDLLPRLLPLLDGSRDLARLADVLPGLSAGALHAAVALLYTCGLLEEGAVEAAGTPAEVSRHRETLSYLTRNLDTTRVNRSGREALGRLLGSRVLVVADGDGGALLTSAPQRSGIAAVRLVACKDLPRLVTPPGPQADLVVTLVSGRERAEALRDMGVCCGAAGVPWLRVRVNERTLEIGPLFEQPESACYDCFLAGRGDEPPAPGSRTAASQDPIVLRAGTALAAAEIVAVLSRVGRAGSLTGWTQLRMDEWEQQTSTVPRLPGCPACDPHGADGTGRHAPALAYAYEQAVAFPPRHRLNPKDHQHHFRPSNLQLQQTRERYFRQRPIPLPPPAARPAPDGHGPGQLDLPTLAGLLLRTTGLRSSGTGGEPTNPGLSLTADLVA